MGLDPGLEIRVLGKVAAGDQVIDEVEPDGADLYGYLYAGGVHEGHELRLNVMGWGHACSLCRWKGDRKGRAAVPGRVGRRGACIPEHVHLLAVRSVDEVPHDEQLRVTSRERFVVVDRADADPQPTGGIVCPHLHPGAPVLGGATGPTVAGTAGFDLEGDLAVGSYGHLSDLHRFRKFALDRG